MATILFTEALFVHHDFVTPLVLQKSQPIFAVLGAMVILGERPRQRFALYFVVALAGTWLMGLQDPFHPQAHGLATMLYALGAAALWALGTVLGRYLARDMQFHHVTTLRFVFGLPASAIALLVLGDPAFASWHDSRSIALLAVVTGFVALLIYYYGLRVTPAVLATIAELAFPVTAILVGYFRFSQTLTGWQWIGVAVTTMVVALLPARSRDAIERGRIRAAAGARAAARVARVCGRHDLRRRPARRAAERAGRARAVGAGQSSSPRSRPRASRGSRRCRSCARIACRRWRAPRRWWRAHGRWTRSSPGLVLNERGFERFRGIGARPRSTARSLPRRSSTGATATRRSARRSSVSVRSSRARRRRRRR